MHVSCTAIVSYHSQPSLYPFIVSVHEAELFWNVVWNLILVSIGVFVPNAPKCAVPSFMCVGCRLSYLFMAKFGEKFIQGNKLSCIDILHIFCYSCWSSNRTSMLVKRKGKRCWPVINALWYFWIRREKNKNSWNRLTSEVNVDWSVCQSSQITSWRSYKLDYVMMVNLLPPILNFDYNVYYDDWNILTAEFIRMYLTFDINS